MLLMGLRKPHAATLLMAENACTRTLLPPPPWQGAAHLDIDFVPDSRARSATLTPRTPYRPLPARQTLTPVSPKTQTRGCMKMSALMLLYRQNRIGIK